MTHIGEACVVCGRVFTSIYEYAFIGGVLFCRGNTCKSDYANQLRAERAVASEPPALSDNSAMTDEEVQEIAARVEAATPGPWKWEPFDSIFAPSVGLYVVKGNGSGVVNDDDAVFIAQAREAIPALLAERAALLEIVRAVAETPLTRVEGASMAATQNGVRYVATVYSDHDIVTQARDLLGK